MKEEIQQLMDKYIDWLASKSVLQEVGENLVEITTPYLDTHNDYLQLYVEKINGGYRLTDDGYIISDLEQSGCKLDGAKRKALLNTTLNGFGVKTENGALYVDSSPDNFALKKHNLVQAMLAVGDLFYVASSHVRSFFLEDVLSWLDSHHIRYTRDIQLTGKSGYHHNFNLVIPRSKKYTERIIRTINKPSRSTVESLTFAWIDTKDTRQEQAEAYAILNDSETALNKTETTISSSISESLKKYGINSILWSEREKSREKLAA